MLSLAMGSCRRGESSAESKATRPNILVVTFDTTRADRLSCYGYTGHKTPTVDKLAADGARYARCHAAAPITLPSHSTLFTGLYPFWHGIRDNGIAALDPQVETLAEVLKKQGYATGAVVGAFVLNARFGLAQGFDFYDDKIDTRTKTNQSYFAERKAEAVSASAADWLETVGDSPFLLWTHYFDPHVPYAAPGAPEGLTPFEAYDLEITYTDAQLARVVDRARSVSKDQGRDLVIVFTADHGEALGEHGEPTHSVFVYEETVHVPLIIVDPRRIKPGTVVDASVSLSDLFPSLLDRAGIPLPYEVHGRKLPADNRATERRAVYFETYMPLNTYGWSPLEGVLVGFDKYIKAPQPERYDLAADRDEFRDLHSHDDERSAALADALQSLKSLTLKAPTFEAATVATDAASARAMAALGYFSRVVADTSEHARLPNPKAMLPFHILINDAQARLGSDPPGDCFEPLRKIMEGDPNNRHALQILCELVASPDRWEPALAMLEERISRPLPEPYDETVPAAIANVLIRQDKAQEAVDLLNPLIAKKQKSVPLLSAMGIALLETRQTQPALEVLTQVVELDPKHRPALTALGDMAFEAGRFSDASARYRAAIDAGDESPESTAIGDPDHDLPPIESAAPRRETIESDLHLKLARSMLATGQAEGVQAILERAVSLDPTHATARMELGAFFLQINRAEEALTQYQEACRLDPDNSDGPYNLGGAMLRLGRLKEAEDAYREALRLKPDHGRCWINLGIALVQQGRREEGKDAFVKATAIEETRAEAYYSLGITLARENDTDGALREYAQALGANPGHPGAMIASARLHLAAGRAPSAVEILRRGLAAAPQFTRATALLAQVLSTSRDDGVRNGREALELAMKANAVTQQRDPTVLQSLACALAETGDLKQAERVAIDAIGKAQAGGAADLVAEITVSLEAIRAGKPVRDPRY